MNLLTDKVQKDNYDVNNLYNNILIGENKSKIQERIEQFNIKYVNALEVLKIVILVMTLIIMNIRLQNYLFVLINSW